MKFLNSTLPVLIVLASVMTASTAVPAAPVPPAAPTVPVVTLHPAPSYAGWLARATANGLHPGSDLDAQIHALAAARRASFVAARILHIPAPTPTPALVHLASAEFLARLSARGRPAFTPPTQFRPVSAPTPPPPPVILSASFPSEYQDGTIAGSNLYLPGGVTMAALKTTCGTYELPITQITPQDGATQTGSIIGHYFVEAPQMGSLSVVVGNLVSNTVSVQLTPSIISSETETDSIADDGSTTCDLLVPCTAPHFNPSSSSRLSQNPRDAVVSGDDILNDGIFPLNSAVLVSAKIASVHSFNDSPNDFSQDNGYRGATISTAPVAGRLQTVVHWYHAGGESINYSIVYTLATLTLGRMTNAIPKVTGCTDEQ